MSDPSSRLLPKVLQPSTMASRRREREARGDLEPHRRLVSLGWRREMVDGLGRDEKPIERWYEVVFDPDHPAEVFVRWSRDGALTPIQRRVYDTGGADRVIDTGVMPRRGRSSGNYPMGRPDEVTLVADDD